MRQMRGEVRGRSAHALPTRTPRTHARVSTGCAHVRTSGRSAPLSHSRSSYIRSFLRERARTRLRTRALACAFEDSCSRFSPSPLFLSFSPLRPPPPALFLSLLPLDLPILLTHNKSRYLTRAHACPPRLRPFVSICNTIHVHAVHVRARAHTQCSLRKREFRTRTCSCGERQRALSCVGVRVCDLSERARGVRRALQVVAAPAKSSGKRDPKMGSCAVPLRQGEVEEDFEAMAAAAHVRAARPLCLTPRKAPSFSHARSLALTHSHSLSLSLALALALCRSISLSYLCLCMAATPSTQHARVGSGEVLPSRTSSCSRVLSRTHCMQLASLFFLPARLRVPVARTRSRPLPFASLPLDRS
eukprot:4826472-Pleurochrysis_carterae.AAC.2